MRMPYRYRGIVYSGLLVIVLPWTAWRFALCGTCSAWYDCRCLTRELAVTAPDTTSVEFAPPLFEAPELILSGGLLDSVRCYISPEVRIAGYFPVTTQQEAGIDIHTAQITLIGPCKELLCAAYRLEQRLPSYPLRSMKWQTVTQPHTHRTSLTLTLYVQQLIFTQNNNE